MSMGDTQTQRTVIPKKILIGQIQNVMLGID